MASDKGRGERAWEHRKGHEGKEKGRGYEEKNWREEMGEKRNMRGHVKGKVKWEAAKKEHKAKRRG